MPKRNKIDVPVYVQKGMMLVRRDALDPDDPDYTYNYIKSEFDVDPEDYGIEKPEFQRCPHCGEML